jgi:DNA-directed RNA polymerase subunit beta
LAGNKTLTVRIGQSRPALFCVEYGVRITPDSAASRLNFRCNAKKRDEQTGRNRMATKALPTINTGAKKRIRKVFGDIHEVVQMPNLIEVQRESYEQFLRSNPAIGYVSGLEKTLRSVFPIRDFAGTAEMDFVHYELEDPKFDVEECRQRGITYAAPMRVTLRLIVFEVDADTETR